MISLPKGGGAIRGMGEKFAANPVTGTGSFSVPIAVSPGRAGFQPELALSYDSGAGNGTCGLGWSMGLPSITRKTDKGLPRYDDAGESDVFILSGAEDLVPAFRLKLNGDVERDAQGRPVPDEGRRRLPYQAVSPAHRGTLRPHRALDEGRRSHGCLLARDHPRQRHLVLRQGRQLAHLDPAAKAHIFIWLICESHDDKGNAIQYEYKEEDGKGVNPALSYEQQHRDAACTAQRYIKFVRYGNVVSRLHPQPPADWRKAWLFEVVFDYGEGHYADLPPDQGIPADEQHPFARASLGSKGEWPVRPTPSLPTARASRCARTGGAGGS